MNTREHLLVLAVVTALVGLTATAARSADEKKPDKPAAKFTRTENVVYGHRDGHALTMDVFTPTAGANGAGVIICVSAGYTSSRKLLDTVFHPLTTTPFLDRGYVVFAVMHSSQPRYTVPDAIDDTHRAVRFVKANAKKFAVAGDKLGIAGGSAGGHLALMMGCAGRVGDADSADRVERESSRVAAVGCFFPPTDFVALDTTTPPKEFAAAFDFHDLDTASGKYLPVTPARRKEIGASISPITFAAKGSVPTRIIHMRGDPVVPFAQSEAMINKLKAAGVECDLMALDGNKHFHPGVARDIPAVADWFDRHLIDKK